MNELGGSLVLECKEVIKPIPTPPPHPPHTIMGIMSKGHQSQPKDRQMAICGIT